MPPLKGLKSPLFLALDVDTEERALQLVEQTTDYVGGYKLGPRLCVQYGASLIQKISQKAPVFVDNKYYDIPNTMVHAVKATFAAGASFVTVHASAGPEALIQMALLEKELNQKRPFQILAVTILTSFSQNTLPPNQKELSIPEQVQQLVRSVEQSGLSAVVCSAQELVGLKESFPHLDFVTPGIRFKEESKGDQKRVMGPHEALLAGATALVVGRPICQASDPRDAAKKYFEAVQVG